MPAQQPWDHAPSASFIYSFLQRARQRRLDQAPDAGSFRNIYFSGSTYSLWRAARDRTAQVCRGLVLDAGSGRGAWKAVICNTATRESVDIEPKGGEQVTWVADLTAMPQVPSGRYDSIVCHQVLEHVPDPAAAISEMFRVLKPGGHIVLSVPHLSRQHELPHDYTRFTPQGLRRLFETAGFEVEEIDHFGGLACFVHHQLATGVLGIAAIARPLEMVVSWLNAPVSVFTEWFDRKTDRRGLLAVGVIARARKPIEACGS